MDQALKLRLIDSLTRRVADHSDELTELDRRIGDGDHGLNLSRGFDVVAADRQSLAALPLPDLLTAIGRTLVMKVGGASGAVFGTFFLEFAKGLPEDPSRSEITAAFTRALDAVKARGKVTAGQKTLVDVLEPVALALSSAAPSLDQVAQLAGDAAEATIPMKATKGRASFLGDRSIGHMDPGARSASLLIAAICTTLEGIRP